MIAAARVPDVPSRLPFVGSALELGRDPDAFFDRCRRRHGDSFTLLLAGRRRTFLCDPLDHPTFFQTRELAFLDVSNELGGRVFGYDWVALRGWGLEALTHQLAVHLRGEELEALSARMLERFPRVL